MVGAVFESGFDQLSRKYNNCMPSHCMGLSAVETINNMIKTIYTSAELN